MTLHGAAACVALHTFLRAQASKQGTNGNKASFSSPQPHLRKQKPKRRQFRPLILNSTTLEPPSAPMPTRPSSLCRLCSFSFSLAGPCSQLSSCSLSSAVASPPLPIVTFFILLSPATSLWPPVALPIATRRQEGTILPCGIDASARFRLSPSTLKQARRKLKRSSATVRYRYLPARDLYVD